MFVFYLIKISQNKRESYSTIKYKYSSGSRPPYMFHMDYRLEELLDDVKALLLLRVEAIFDRLICLFHVPRRFLFLLAQMQLHSTLQFVQYRTRSATRFESF